MKTRRRLSEAEPELRRRADRERVKEVASELLCSEDWRRLSPRPPDVSRVFVAYLWA